MASISPSPLAGFTQRSNAPVPVQAGRGQQLLRHAVAAIDLDEVRTSGLNGPLLIHAINRNLANSTIRGITPAVSNLNVGSGFSVAAIKQASTVFRRAGYRVRIVRQSNGSGFGIHVTENPRGRRLHDACRPGLPHAIDLRILRPQFRSTDKVGRIVQLTNRNLVGSVIRGKSRATSRIRFGQGYPRFTLRLAAERFRGAGFDVRIQRTVLGHQLVVEERCRG